MAVSAINDKGNPVVFDVEGSAIIPRGSSEAAEIRKIVQQCKAKVELERTGGVFTMRAWRTEDEKSASVFTRPGR